MLMTYFDCQVAVKILRSSYAAKALAITFAVQVEIVLMLLRWFYTEEDWLLPRNNVVFVTFWFISTCVKRSFSVHGFVYNCQPKKRNWMSCEKRNAKCVRSTCG